MSICNSLRQTHRILSAAFSRTTRSFAAFVIMTCFILPLKIVQWTCLIATQTERQCYRNARYQGSECTLGQVGYLVRVSLYISSAHWQDDAKRDGTNKECWPRRNNIHQLRGWMKITWRNSNPTRPT